MNVICNAILQKTKLENVSFLNWDHEVIPTQKTDVLFHISNYVKRVTGWDTVVTLDDNVLNIRAPEETLLTYDIKTGREIYGRLRHVGITFNRLKELEECRCLA